MYIQNPLFTLTYKALAGNAWQSDQTSTEDEDDLAVELLTVFRILVFCDQLEYMLVYLFLNRRVYMAGMASFHLLNVRTRLTT